MNKILIFFLCLSFLFIPKTIKEDQYTIYIPNNPTSMIIYYHSNMVLYHSKGRKPRTFYNFQEDYIKSLSEQNPNSIVIVTYYYNQELVEYIEEIIKEYNISNIIVSGWSAGGNSAIYAAAQLSKLDINTQLLLIDCNHTNEVDLKYIKQLANNEVTIAYISNIISPAKNKKISNIISYKIPISYFKIEIPEGYIGSNHMYCRNSTMDFNLYGYLLGGPLNENYEQGYYNYSLQQIEFPK